MGVEVGDEVYWYPKLKIPVKKLLLTNTTKRPWLRITKMHLDLDDFGGGIAKLP